MAIQTVGWVLDHSEARGFERLVLISLANHANRQGANCRPSLATLAAEARVSRSAAGRAVQRLEAAGELLRRPGLGRGNPTAYVLTLGRPPADCAALFDDPEEGSPAENRRTDPSGLGGNGGGAGHLVGGKRPAQADQLATLNGVPAGHFEPTNVPEMSQKCPAPSRARVLVRPSDSIKPENHGTERARARAPTAAPAVFPVTEEMRRQAETCGVPADRVEAETAKFLDHFRASGARKVDWRAAWRNWMRRVPDFAPAPGAPRGSAAAVGRTARQRASLDRVIEIAKGDR